MHDVFPIERIKLYPYVDNDGNTSIKSDEFTVTDLLDRREGPEGTEWLVKYEAYKQPVWQREEMLNAACQELMVAWVRAQKERAALDVYGQGHSLPPPKVTQGRSLANPVGVAKAFRAHRKHHLAAIPEDVTLDDGGAVPTEAEAYRYDQQPVKATKPKQKQKVSSPPAPNATSVSPPPAPAPVPVLTVDEVVQQTDHPITHAVAAAKTGRVRQPVARLTYSALTIDPSTTTSPGEPATVSTSFATSRSPHQYPGRSNRHLPWSPSGRGRGRGRSQSTRGRSRGQSQ